MAQQDSTIKLRGKVGDLSFYHNDKGYQVRTAKGIDARRIATDPAFQRTRENSREFGRAVLAAQKLRKALRPLETAFADSSLSNRLHSRLFRMLLADEQGNRGERQVKNEHSALLRNFNLNAQAALHETALMPYQCKMDRAGGYAQLLIPAFQARACVVAPKGSSHFQLISAGLVLDFDDEAATAALQMQRSDLHTKHAPIPEQVFQMHFSTASSSPVFILLGICFFQETQGYVYPQPEGPANAMGIVEVF